MTTLSPITSATALIPRPAETPTVALAQGTDVSVKRPSWSSAWAMLSPIRLPTRIPAVGNYRVKRP